MQNILSALAVPSHAAAAQTRFYNAFASSLDRTAADRQAASKEISVHHLAFIASEKSFLLLQFILHPPEIIQRTITVSSGIGLVQRASYLHCAKGCQEVFNAGHFPAKSLVVE